MFASRASWCHPNLNKICINIFSSYKHQQKCDIPNLKVFLVPKYTIFWVFRGIGQLSSLMSWRVMAFSQNGPRLRFVGFECLSNFCFLRHYFGTRYARMPIMGCKDSNDHLDSKKIVPKMSCWVGALGHVNLVKKAKICPHQRWADCEIFQSDSSPDLIKLDPI